MLDSLAASLSTTVLVAYSLRKLRGAYVGNCIKVRRSTDSATLNFGFSNTGFFDSAAVTAWLAGATGTIDTWYDQSGNGNDIVQGTAGTQPRLVIGGDSDTNSMSYVYIGEAASHKLTATVTVTGLSSAIISCVAAPVGSQTSGANNVNNAIIYWAESASWGGVALSPLAAEVAWRFGTGQASNLNTKSKASSNVAGCFAVIKRTTSEFAYFNGAQVSTTNTGKTTPTANTSTAMQVGNGDGAGVPNTKCMELIFFTNAPATTEDLLHTNQAATYGTP